MTLDRIEGLNNGGIVNLIVKLWISVSVSLNLPSTLCSPLSCCSIFYCVSIPFTMRTHCDRSDCSLFVTIKWWRLDTMRIVQKTFRDNIVTYTEFMPKTGMRPCNVNRNFTQIRIKNVQMLFFAP